MVKMDILYLDVKAQNARHVLDFLYISIFITNKRLNPRRSNINSISNYLIYLLACENSGLQSIGEIALTLNKCMNIHRTS